MRNTKISGNNNTNYPANLENNAPFLSRFTFFWTNKVIQRGQDFSVKESDLFDIREREKLYSILEKIDFSTLKYPKRGLTFHLFYTCLQYFCISAVCSFTSAALSFSGLIFLSLIIKNIDDPQSEEWKGYLFASLLFLCFFFRVFLGQHATHMYNKVTFQIMNQMMGIMYKKLLKLSNSSRKYFDSGKMTNLVIMNTVDVLGFYQFAFLSLSAPFTILAISAYIIYELGPVGLIVPFFLLVSAIIVQKVQKKSAGYKKESFVIADQRSKQITEFFQGIKIIKYYAWEEWAIKILQKIRYQEVKLIFNYLFNIGIVESISNMAPSIIAVLVFLFYILQGNELTASTAYTGPIVQIISGWSKYSQSQVSYARVLHFLSAEEINPKHQDNDLFQCLSLGDIQIVNGYFSWESPVNETHNNRNPDTSQVRQAQKKKLQQQIKDKKKKKERTTELEESLTELIEKEVVDSKISPTLSNINLKIKGGTLNGIYGLFSSGKTSLAHCLINEIYKISGEIALKGKIAYIPQQPWLRSFSFRDNILFGEPFDKKRYKKILKICELNDDLSQLPGGDMTEIGERGVNLSGGQKQRISIARSLYSNRDIFVVDDCLSALDSHVGKFIFENVFLKYLKGKTIVFITHQMHLMPYFDTITIMKSGRIQDHGNYRQLVANNSEALEFLKSSKKEDEQKIDTIEEKVKDVPVEKQSELEILSIKIEKESQLQQQEISLDDQSCLQNDEQILNNQKEDDFEEDANENHSKKEKGILVKKEDQAGGSVPFSVYKGYVQMGGYLYVLLAFVVFAIAQILLMLSDWWLGQWSSLQYPSLEDKEYAGIYAGLSLSGGILFLLRYVAFLLFSLQVSKKAFEKLVERLLHCPMSFFDTTPLGRITARFAKDIDAIDYYLQTILQQLIGGFMTVIGSFIMISMITPIFLVVCIGLVVLYILVLKMNIRCQREIKRIIDNIRAPLFGVFTELNQGLVQIRSSNKENFFFSAFAECADAHTRATFNSFYCDRWLGIITDFFSTIVIAASAYLGLAQKSINEGDYHQAALIGLSLTWALKISFSLPSMIKWIAETELQMNSVQRILNYIDETPQEREYIMKNEESKQAQDKWPVHSTLDIKNISYRYRDDTPIILKNISLSIKSNERIGVIGRTGSGKSTLTLGLLRILELADEERGSVTLDGKNISKMGLKMLRSNVSMIPQDPVLFSGTIKSNVDPFNYYSNKEVVDALQKVQLWEPLLQRVKENQKSNKDISQIIEIADQNTIGDIPLIDKREIDSSISQNLKVETGGSNFSQGEKQLLVLSRVILRKCKLLLMDEATASIDEKTDWIIQDMVRSYFTDTTIITIAHRLKTIIQYDKILVLSDGEVKEFDSPKSMLQNNNSYLLQLIREQGQKHEEEMKNLAFR